MEQVKYINSIGLVGIKPIGMGFVRGRAGIKGDRAAVVAGSLGLVDRLVCGCQRMFSAMISAGLLSDCACLRFAGTSAGTGCCCLGRWLVVASCRGWRVSDQGRGGSRCLAPHVSINGSWTTKFSLKEVV